MVMQSGSCLIASAAKSNTSLLQRGTVSEKVANWFLSVHCNKYYVTQCVSVPWEHRTLDCT